MMTHVPAPSASAGSGQRPTFLVLGAYKAGTTSLHHYLAQHPQIFMSTIKEIRFLTFAGHQRAPLSPLELSSLSWPVRTLAEYEAMFAGTGAIPARGDVSPCYLTFARQTVLGIKAYVPDAKLIAVLRQPADRAYSGYVSHVGSGHEEELDFRRALQREAEGQKRALDGQHRLYLLAGFYFASLRHYFQHFPREQIRIYLYEELQGDAAGMMRDLFRFIGVDDRFVADTSTRHNSATWPRMGIARPLTARAERLLSRTASRLPSLLRAGAEMRLARLLATAPPPLDPTLRSDLTERYRDDILRTQDLIDRDLSHWLK